MFTKRYYKKRYGFTLLEMMVVLALIAVLASVTAPSLSRIQDREKSRGFANEVANQLKMARLQARSQGQPLLVTITPGVPGASAGSIQVQRGEPYCRDTSGTPGSSGKCANGVPPRAPITCDELFSASTSRSNFSSELLPVNDFRRVSADNYIVGTSVGTNPTVICFAPDGQVRDQNHGKLAFSSNGVCDGDALVVVTARNVAAADRVYSSKPLMDLAKCEHDNATIRGREELDMYLVTVSNTGTIRTLP